MDMQDIVTPPDTKSTLLCVGGAPRSGTELMRQILNRLPSVHLAPETHVFGDLIARLDCDTHAELSGDELELALDYFSALSEAPYGQPGDRSTTKLSLTDLLNMAATPSVASIYEAYCKWSAAENLAPSPAVWGDKTPRHIFAVDLILKQFPGSKFLAMVRDPRAVLLSYRDWQNRWFEGQALDPVQRSRIAAEEKRVRRSYHPFTIPLLWRSATQASIEAAARYPERVRIVRFEDLVDNPENEIRLICDWLRVPFDRAALRVEHLNSSFVGRIERAGFDRTPLDRWKERLSATEMRVAEYLSGPAFRRLGYRSSGESSNFVEVLEMLMTFFPAVFDAAWANRGRRGSFIAFLKERMQHL